jgi:hypothetical protein
MACWKRRGSYTGIICDNERKGGKAAQRLASMPDLALRWILLCAVLARCLRLLSLLMARASRGAWSADHWERRRHCILPIPHCVGAWGNAALDAVAWVPGC